MLLPKGVFITMTPFLEASGMSTLSTPIPARPTTLRFVAAARTSAVTLVAERIARRSEEHTSELQSLMRISYAVFCLKKKTNHKESSQTKSHSSDNTYRCI